MIELITGLPGNGKTLYTISQVKKRAEQENRQVFYHGIPELTLGWEHLEDAKEWASCPPNSIIVIDEAQKIFRNRSMGAQPPQFVQDLETHRHLGIDLVMITQHPNLIDPAVRRLAGKHQHLVRIWGTEASTVHRWDSVKDNCDKNRTDSEKTKWAFDKSVYSLYKSAEVHTMKRSIPARVKMLVGLCVIFVAIAVYFAMFIKKKVSGPDLSTPATATAPAPGQVNVDQVMQHGALDDPVDPVEDARAYAASFTPRIEGLPHTAPRYDAITVPVRAPVPAMCVKIGTVYSEKGMDCRCYSQQGTKMHVEFNMCMEFVNEGRFQDFDPEPRRQAQSQPEPVRQVAAAELPPLERYSPGQVLSFPSVPDAPRVQGRPMK